MLKAEQGDILKIVGLSWPVLVISNNRFNEIGEVLACPILSDVKPNAVHLPVCIALASGELRGTVVCEQVKHLDLNVRRFAKLGSMRLGDLLDISDTMTALFECI